jgi:DMSO/TMAO reductase YedYZ heme-binding membrane subunit
VCAVLHYLWLAKKANPAPYYYAAVFIVLMAIRAWGWSRRASKNPLPGGERVG